MFKKFLSLTLIVLLINLMGVGLAFAADSKENKEARFVQKVKDGINKLGTGVKTHVEVKLKDKRRLRGYISEAGEDTFTIIDEKTGNAATIPYPQVKQVRGNNLSTGAAIAIGVGLGVLAVILIVYAYIAAHED